MNVGKWHGPFNTLRARFGDYEPVAGKIGMQVLRDPACAAGGEVGSRTMVPFFAPDTTVESCEWSCVGVDGEAGQAGARLVASAAALETIIQRLYQSKEEPNMGQTKGQILLNGRLRVLGHRAHMLTEWRSGVGQEQAERMRYHAWP